MIEKTQSYKASSGEVFEHLSDAQRHEIELILKGGDPKKVCDETAIDVVAKLIVEQKDAVIDILTTGPRSHVKARKANGATRKPRVSVAAKPGVVA